MKQLYVYFDKISNHVLCQWIPFVVSDVTIPVPNYILLLKGSSPLAEYDDFTGFYYIHGQEKVQRFLVELERKPEMDINWIDFQSLELLHQLTPQEIADLLYISHTNTHLHSPFFYKLQNHYIYLSLESGFTKTYYRKIDRFLARLASSITKQMIEIVPSSPLSFFKKTEQIPVLQAELLKDLLPYLKLGILFSFSQLTKTDTGYSIPIIVVEDRVYEEKPNMETCIGTIDYQLEEKMWQLRLVGEQVGLN